MLTALVICLALFLSVAVLWCFRTQFWRQSGNILYEAAQFRGAIICYSMVLKDDANAAECHWRRGLCHAYLEDWQSALDDFREALKFNPSLPEIHYNVGLVLFKLADLQGSLREFETEIAQNRKFAPAYVAKGIVLSAMGRHAEALQCENVAISLDPLSVEARKGKDWADALIQLKPTAARPLSRTVFAGKSPDFAGASKPDFVPPISKEAERQIPLAVQKSNNPPLVQAERNNLESRSAKQDEPKREARVVMEKPDAMGMARLAEAKFDARQFEDSVRYYSKAISISTSSSTFYRGRGRALYKLERFSEALSDFTKAVELQPDKDINYDLRASCYEALHDYKNAEIDYLKAGEIAPLNRSEYEGKLAVLKTLSVGPPASGRKRATAVEGERARKTIREELGTNTSRYSRLSQEDQKIIEKVDLLMQVAEARSQSGEYQAALAATDEAIEKLNSSPGSGTLRRKGRVYAVRALVYDAMNDLKSSREALDLSLEFNPDNLRARRLSADNYKKQGMMYEFRQEQNLLRNRRDARQRGRREAAQDMEPAEIVAPSEPKQEGSKTDNDAN